VGGSSVVPVSATIQRLHPCEDPQTHALEPHSNKRKPANQAGAGEHALPLQARFGDPGG